MVSKWDVSPSDGDPQMWGNDQVKLGGGRRKNSLEAGQRRS